MRRRKVLFINGLLPAIAICSLLPLNAVQAAPITVNFTGMLSDVSNGLSGPFGAMQTVNGSMTVEVPTPTPTGGTYDKAVTGFTLNLSTLYSASFVEGVNKIRIENQPGDGVDHWKLMSDATGTSVNGYTPAEFEFGLAGKHLVDDNSLQTPHLGAMFTSTSFRLIFNNPEGDVARIQGVISQLTAVPLPGAVVLFGIGLISLVGLGAGGLRNLP